MTCVHHALYKYLKRLATSSIARQEAQKTILEGVHLAQMYLRHCGMPHVCIVCDDAMHLAEVNDIVRQCREHAANTHCTSTAWLVSLSRSRYSAISPVACSAGIMFVIAMPEKAKAAMRPHQYPLLSQSAVLLDNIQDPGNLGSILRSASAAGITHIFCSKGCAAPWSPKVLRAGMGAHFLLSIMTEVDLFLLITRLTIPVLATSPKAVQSIYDMSLDRPVAWIFGHEGQGVSPALRAQVHQVTIPQNAEMESLNVAVASAICFFEQVRQTKAMARLT